jgi:Flp pilus assembly protein protease CpaA
MFNDRDLGVLGAGAVLAVLGLLLPFSFGVRVALGCGVLVGGMVLAFLRLGPDRIPPEEWLRRRVRYQLQARRYTYQQAGAARKRRKPWRIGRPARRFPRPEQAGAARSTPVDPPPFPSSWAGLRPLALALDETWVYPLATLLLGVVGIYLLAWLGQGGAAEIARLIGGVLR